MKKLFQKLLERLSKANKRIFKLERELEFAYDSIDGLRKEIEEHKDKIQEWKDAFDKRDDFWCEKFYAQKHEYERLVLFVKNLVHPYMDKKEEEEWMDDVCWRYPTEEVAHDRFIAKLEAQGNLEAYYESQAPYDPFYDDPEEKWAWWCLCNNVDRGDEEAKRYLQYNRDCYYCHDEVELENESYVKWVEETLGIKHDNIEDVMIEDDEYDWSE